MLKSWIFFTSRLVTACAYKDVSGLCTTEVPEELENSTSGGSGSKKDTTAPVANTEVDDEDELLYGADHVISTGCRTTNFYVCFDFLTAILHRGLRNDFFFFFSSANLLFPLFYLDFYFPFLFGLLFPFSIWTFFFSFSFFFSTRFNSF